MPTQASHLRDIGQTRTRYCRICSGHFCLQTRYHAYCASERHSRMLKCNRYCALFEFQHALATFCSVPNMFAGGLLCARTLIFVLLFCFHLLRDQGQAPPSLFLPLQPIAFCALVLAVQGREGMAFSPFSICTLFSPTVSYRIVIYSRDVGTNLLSQARCEKQ